MIYIRKNGKTLLAYQEGGKLLVRVCADDTEQQYMADSVDQLKALFRRLKP